MHHNTFNYSTLQSWSKKYYQGLLGKEMIQDLITVKGSRYVFLQNGLRRYLLPIESLEELPILPTKTETIDYRAKPHEIILAYKSARFKPERHRSFRELVDELCAFEHSSPRDYTLWKIIALCALIHRTNYRVCSQPSFGKDSVMKVLGYLTGDVCVIANPTVAKLEYRLTNNVILLNEFANLKSDDRYGMEHFLQSVGDLSNTYEKRSRAGQGTSESFNIGELSVVCAYNDVSCYVDDSKYFDNVFSDQTRDRFIPYKFLGKIAQQIENVEDPDAMADSVSEYLQKYMRTIMYYRQQWRTELLEKRLWDVPDASKYGITGRWATNYNRHREFILLYSESQEEATMLLNTLYNRHVAYREQFSQGMSLSRDWLPKQPEDLPVTFDDVVKQ